MCGRYQLVLPADAIARLFDLDDAGEDFPPRYNIAPTQPVHVIHAHPTAGRAMSLMRWGLLPSWVKDPKAFPLIINARSETAADKPAFRNALRRRRAVLPATGFYEWEKRDDGKRPILFTADALEIFGLAAVWETWAGPNGEEMDTVAILTAAAIGVPAGYHDRMPLTVPLDRLAAWLDPANENAADALGLAERLSYAARPVSRLLSNARNEGVGLMTAEPDEPVPAEEKVGADTPQSDPVQGTLF